MTEPHVAVLFDLDGTLIDSIDLLLECMESAFADRERRPSRPEWTAGIGKWSDWPDTVKGFKLKFLRQAPSNRILHHRRPHVVLARQSNILFGLPAARFIQRLID